MSIKLNNTKAYLKSYSDRLIKLLKRTLDDKKITYTGAAKNSLRQNIVEDKRFYDLPSDAIQIKEVRCKNHLNSKDEYRQIPRLINKPIIKDADGE